MVDAETVFPEVILFEDANFRGAHRHVFQEEKDLNAIAARPVTTPGPAGGPFAGKTSSMVVVKGHWTFCTKKNFDGGRTTVKPGPYHDVEDQLGIENDAILSVRQATAAEVAALPPGTGTAGSSH
jgi:hypothetical protein